MTSEGVPKIKGLRAPTPRGYQFDNLGKSTENKGFTRTDSRGTQFGNLGKNKESDVSIPRGGQFDHLGENTENKGFRAHRFPEVINLMTSGELNKIGGIDITTQNNYCIRTVAKSTVKFDSLKYPKEHNRS